MTFFFSGAIFICLEERERDFFSLRDIIDILSSGLIALGKEREKKKEGGGKGNNIQVIIKHGV